MKTTPSLLILIALAFPCAPAFADSSDIPEWYGTIRFTKTLHRRTDDPLEFQGQPGVKVSDVKVTWSGSIRFMPGRKAVVSAHYTFTRLADRREDRTNKCTWKTEETVYHDYETISEETKVSFTRPENNRLAFILKPDGTYRVSVIVNGGKQVDKALRSRTWREFYDECSEPHLQVNDQKGVSSGGMESITLAHVEGKAKPGATTLSGTWTGEDDDRGKFSYSWDLSLAEPQLVARVQATPSPVVRGASVTLDGKASTGKIDKYEWQFTPDGDCQMTKEGLAVKLTGLSVTFTALCDFTAELKVSNAKDSDRTWQAVVVEARKGKAWETQYKSVPGENFAQPITAGLIHAGVNQCAAPAHGKPPDPNQATGHWLHTTDPKNRTWRTVGYVLAQVQDPGPFKGDWYVLSQSLMIDRLERVNVNLLKGGPTYELNAGKKNVAAMNSWSAQVQAHEAMHSALVREKLEKLKPDRDPAVLIEKLVGAMDEADFQDLQVDFAIRATETELQQVTTEEMVSERLHKEDRFKDQISIWPDKDAKSPMKIGPLWRMGFEPKS